MSEIKAIGKINLKYNGYSEPTYLFLNTYDNSIYLRGKGADAIPTISNLTLDKEPEYFEEDAEILEEIVLPYEKIDESDFRVELVLLFPTINVKVKVNYSYLYYGADGVMQELSFQTPINLIGGSY